ncbi:MAG: IS481 family transposase, partial [Candidatus Pacebacteria bacterium]|nr:IS481 family transposase [Candidatus Paceibacterota bacterium]MDD3969695.1 IS481 family transposase [Candidatus Paceibacterota bacterium]
MRRALYRAWVDGVSVTDLSLEYKITRKTVYKVLERARLQDFENHLSVNLRFRTIKYGLRKLRKTAERLQKRIDRENIKRYEKEYPGEMVHFDTKRLPLLSGEAIRDKREHLHVAIDDFSRYLVADIFPDKG